jgi:hypothetical protein
MAALRMLAILKIGMSNYLTKTSSGVASISLQLENKPWFADDKDTAT